MTDLSLITSLPEVRGAVRGDLAGAFLDAVREPDGESVAAVMGYVADMMLHAAEELGLGALHRISLASESAACLVLVDGESVITAFVEPPKALSAVERVLDVSLQEQE